MRRALLAVVIAALAGVVGLPAVPAHAVLGVQADLAVTAAGTPATVAPPGGNVIYDVTATNNGPAPSVVVNFTDTVSGGGTIIAGETSVPAGCTVGNATVTCDDLVVISGQPRAFKVVVKTPSSIGNVVNSAHISSDIAGLDENASNDNAQVSTPVTDNTNGSGSLVLSGQCLAYKDSKICVPQEVRGVIVALTDANLAGADCGGRPCAAGINVGFTQDDEYKAEDPTHPLVVDLSFGKGYPCRSLSEKCADIYVRESAGGPTYKLPLCLPGNVFTPCEVERHKIGADVHWTINMLSNDPDLLKNLTGGL
jgi:uncharacterized repeat protein (TIGR01451 family)